MKVEKDFADFIKLLNNHKVEYLIVGAYALALYAEPRNTGDIDIFINRTDENVNSILKVLADFGFEGLGLTKSDFKTENNVIQLGVPPVRIDILTSISGVDFNDAYKDKYSNKFGNTTADFISKDHLIKNKKASSRKKDIADLESLLNS
ncbi:MAG: hypothetical protein QY331_07250 [Melioribacteraceae bacterium]|nr:MAG: hypothetical protein QY331_07250 [Melioribacteraceae bacterium]